MNIEDLIYGTSKTERIVACDYDDDDNLEVWREIDGQVVSEKHRVPYFLISSRASTDSIELAGTLPLKHLRTFQTKQDYWNERRRQRGALFLNLYDDREAAMMLSGITFFKGMEPRDVSVLSFDIESTGLVKDETSKVLLISNSFQKDGIIIRKLFAYDDYSTEGEMLTKWCDWVREMNPSIITGHNIYSYDLPYMDYCARQSGVSLNLGRDGSSMRFNNYESNFRVDQSNFYPFYNALIYGRSIVDTYFLSMRYDYVEKKYSSYGLKNIIREEGIERQGRIHYDAGQIRLRYKEPEEWAKIKVYAEHDADDSLALYNIMIPAYFYLTKSVPKHFQIVMTSAPGAQINSLITRAYIQSSHSLPLPTETSKFEGSISFGNPGVYENVIKVDVASMFPSIMMEYKVYDSTKDPLNVTLRLLDFFTTERLKNKKLAADTGNRAYKSLSDAQKICANSFFGFLGTTGLSFNAPHKAAEVTRIGRELLTVAMNWATEG